MKPPRKPPAPCKHERLFAACPDCAARWDIKGTLWVKPIEELDLVRAENERLREALAQMCLAVKDVKNGNVTLGDFIDCASAILTNTAP